MGEGLSRLIYEVNFYMGVFIYTVFLLLGPLR